MISSRQETVNWRTYKEDAVKKEQIKMTLQLVKAKKLRILKTKQGKVDDILVGLSGKDTIIATQDKELKKRIKGKKIVLRQKKYLVLV